MHIDNADILLSEEKLLSTFVIQLESIKYKKIIKKYENKRAMWP